MFMCWIKWSSALNLIYSVQELFFLHNDQKSFKIFFHKNASWPLTYRFAVSTMGRSYKTFYTCNLCQFHPRARVEPLLRYYCKGRFLTLPENIRLGVNFINIFGKKQMAKSAKLPVNCKKIKLCVQKLELCAKSSFFVIGAKKPV